jgi:hypothetical protein
MSIVDRALKTVQLRDMVDREQPRESDDIKEGNRSVPPLADAVAPQRLFDES